jgi:hypothetical protein
MKKLLSLLVVGALAASVAVAADPPPAPTPDPVSDAPGVAAPGAPADLFKCVKYVDVKSIACDAKPIVVQVQDPCWKPDPCKCGEKPRCVNVEICVPQNGCPPIIKCSKDGKKVKYDYGRHAVDIRVKKASIEVDYQG